MEHCLGVGTPTSRNLPEDYLTQLWKISVKINPTRDPKQFVVRTLKGKVERITKHSVHSWCSLEEEMSD